MVTCRPSGKPSTGPRTSTVPSADSRQNADGLVIDFDAEGNVVGIDIDHASQKLDLKTLEAVALPAVTTRV
ncbi:MAG: DUF2283 domain-containing protein [Acidobacteria bacterium]|nr:DUF2283 domain-containing protein [Acidobacteriota bacterium]